MTGAVVPEAVFTIDEYRGDVLGRIYADLAPHDPDGVLAEEWVNARGRHRPLRPHGDRDPRARRAGDARRWTWPSPACIVATLRALCAETWSDMRSLQAWRTEDLARYFDAAVAGAEKTGDP